MMYYSDEYPVFVETDMQTTSTIENDDQETE